MGKFVDLLAVQCSDGSVATFEVPTSTAHKGDLVYHDGEHLEIICTEWVNTDNKLYKVMKDAGQILVPEKIFAVLWEHCPAEEESEAADADA
jgi:hypothetical protein